MEGNIVRFITEVDWRHSTLKDDFKYTWREGPISAKLANWLSIFRDHCPINRNYLKTIFFENNYAKKRLVVGQPVQENFESNDYFLGLLSKCDVVVTVVVLKKFSSVKKTTRVKINEIYSTLEKAISSIKYY